MLAKNKELEKRKRLSKRMIIIGSVFAVLFFSLSVSAFYVQSIITSKNSNDTSTASFVVESGQGLKVISENLKNAGLVKSDFIFVLYLKLNGKAGGVQAGEYEIAKNLTMVELAEVVTVGDVSEEKITFPEGWTIKKISDILCEFIFRTILMSWYAKNHTFYAFFLYNSPKILHCFIINFNYTNRCSNNA